MTPKQISWISQDCFLDVDIPVISQLVTDYKINWYIVLPEKKSRYKKDSLEEYSWIGDVNLTIVKNSYRFRSIGSLNLYWKLIKKVKLDKSSLNYINFQGFPYLAIVCAFLIKRKNTIIGVHQAKVHEGMKYKIVTKMYFRFLYSWFNYFHLFSLTQEKLFNSIYGKKKTFMIPLGLKDFGYSKICPNNEKVVFFNFGTIIKNKNIGLLIEASCKLYEKGYDNFVVKIVGACENWNEYKTLLKYPELFQLQIESISNEDIAPLFCSSHYLVLPYSAVSQSGPLKIAFNYNVPVIASNLEEFKNEVIDGETGYLFENLSSDNLEEVMGKAIELHKVNYSVLKRNQKKFVEENYSKESIKKKYTTMFNYVLSGNGKH